jgi:hypothetical protein
MPDLGTVHDPDREPPAVACLERTRSAVLNVLVVVGAGIAASGWALGRHEPVAAPPWVLLQARRASLAALIGRVVLAYAILRVAAGRESLRDPAHRASRFFKARVAAASVAALAIPLGFAHGWFVDPRMEALAPFWVAALGLGLLALPRGPELDGFDEPMKAEEWNRQDANR